MRKTKHTAADLIAVSDNLERTADDFAKPVPFDKAFSELAATIRPSREIFDHSSSPSRRRSS